MKLKNYWSKEKCHEEALKYETRSQFYINSKGAYLKASRNKWLNDICSHMQIQGSLYKRLIYVYEFSDNYAYIGLTFNLNRRNKHHLSNKNSQVFKHIQKTQLIPILKTLTHFLDVEEAQKMEEYYVNYYKENNWNILNKSKTGAIGGCKKIKWTYENCLLEASKYSSRKQFKENSSGAYDACLNNKWLNEVCFHMTGKIYIKWTKKLCYEEYLKYNSKRDFRLFSRNAYTACLSNKWLDDIYKHNI